jgi:Protein of unknown function (DUF3313)
MHNQHLSRRMPQRVASQPQNSRVNAVASLRQFIYPSLLVGSLLLMGVTTPAQDLSKKQGQILSQQSGFLTDYSRLQPDPNNPDLLIYWKNKDAFKHSGKFIIDPIIVYLLPEAQQRGIDTAQFYQLTQNFTKAITDQLKGPGGYEIVTAPGPGVMVLRTAITNVEPTGGKKNAALKGTATAASVAVAPGASLLVPRLSVGKVSIEGEILDSESGQVEVDFMSSKAGRRYFSGLKAYQSWGDINAAFRSWAKGFRIRLDKAHQA